MPDSEITQALIEARDYIIAHGWKRGVSYHLSQPTAKCMIDAFGPGRIPELAIYRLCAATGVGSGTQLIHWNDHIAQDQDEVIEVFNRAIKSPSRPLDSRDHL